MDAFADRLAAKLRAECACRYRGCGCDPDRTLLHAPRPPRKPYQHSEGQAQNGHDAHAAAVAGAPSTALWAASIQRTCRRSNGVCIKCCACVKGCPTGAKYFDDPGYLYHKSELEEVYARPAKNEVFL